MAHQTRGGVERDTVEFGGWPNCIRLANDELELIATTDVGPRIIHLARLGGRNVFHVFEHTLGRTGGDAWESYGGHRLWHAPEVMPDTYAPDNGPVEHAWDGHTLTLSTDEPATGLTKRVAITPDPRGARVLVEHRIVNRNQWAIELAPWALSVMDRGGRAVVPQEDFRPHPENLAPARPLVLWPFNDMSDPRWTWGRRYIQLRQDPGASSKLKVGVANSKGWAAYLVHGVAFVKRYPFRAGATYPDMGVNTELFTDPHFLEVETLGPLVRLEPGGHADHAERWGLEELEAGSDENDLDQRLLPLVGSVAPIEG